MKQGKVNKEITPRMLPVPEAASYLGIAVKTLRNRIGSSVKVRIFPDSQPLSK